MSEGSTVQLVAQSVTYVVTCTNCGTENSGESLKDCKQCGVSLPIQMAPVEMIQVRECIKCSGRLHFDGYMHWFCPTCDAPVKVNRKPDCEAISARHAVNHTGNSTRMTDGSVQCDVCDVLARVQDLEAQLRQKSALSGALVTGMVLRAEAEMAGLKEPCVCPYCGESHERLVRP